MCIRRQSEIIPNLSTLNPKAESLTRARVCRCAQAILARLILFIGICCQGIVGTLRTGQIAPGEWEFRVGVVGLMGEPGGYGRLHAGHLNMTRRRPCCPVPAPWPAAPAHRARQKRRKKEEPRRSGRLACNRGARLPSRRLSAPAACPFRFHTPCNRHPLALASVSTLSVPRRSLVPATRSPQCCLRHIAHRRRTTWLTRW